MNTITPMLHMSLLVPYFSLRSISGAIYPGVPHIVVSEYSPGANFAKPKSAILMLVSEILLDSSKFSGLRSRWTMPRELM